MAICLRKSMIWFQLEITRAASSYHFQLSAFCCREVLHTFCACFGLVGLFNLFISARVRKAGKAAETFIVLAYPAPISRRVYCRQTCPSDISDSRYMARIDSPRASNYGTSRTR
jgi:hypothetical protein